MNQKVRVGIIGIKGLPARAGADRVVEALVRRFPSMGITPTVFCDRSTTAADYGLDGVRIVRVRSLPGKYFSAPTRFLASATRALLSEELDLVHLHNIEASFILPLLRLKYPVVSTAHGFAYWRSKWGPLARQVIKLADWPFAALSSVVTSVSEKDAGQMRSRFHRDVVFIPNGVSSDFQPDIAAAAHLLSSIGLSAHNYLIFVAGRIEPTKGADLIIAAVNRLERELPLLVVGDLNQVPAYKSELEQMAGPRIHFLGPIQSPGVLFGLMVGARCLIFPSLVEAMSMVLLEAASLGVPILASDIQENRSVMAEDIQYFESGSVESLVDRLEWVLDHPIDMEQKSQKARDRVHREYNWDGIAARYAELYRQISRKRT